MNSLIDLTNIRLYESAHTVFQRERAVIDNSQTEVYKRLCWRFPDRNIHESDIIYNGFENTWFSDVSSKGYVVEFHYEGDEYFLHTIDGKSFLSHTLNINKYYEEHVLIMAMSHLFRVVGESFSRSDLIIDFFDEYQSQNGETQFMFDIIFKGTMYPLCFNSRSEPRQREV